MDNDVNEISYLILQHKYLERNGMDGETDLRKISELFPPEWFSEYELEGRVKIISYALKNNISIEDSINIIMEEEKNEIIR